MIVSTTAPWTDGSGDPKFGVPHGGGSIKSYGAGGTPAPSKPVDRLDLALDAVLVMVNRVEEFAARVAGDYPAADAPEPLSNVSVVERIEANAMKLTWLAQRLEKALARLDEAL